VKGRGPVLLQREQPVAAASGHGKTGAPINTPADHRSPPTTDFSPRHFSEISSGVDSRPVVGAAQRLAVDGDQPAPSASRCSRKRAKQGETAPAPAAGTAAKRYLARQAVLQHQKFAEQFLAVDRKVGEIRRSFSSRKWSPSARSLEHLQWIIHRALPARGSVMPRRMVIIEIIALLPAERDLTRIMHRSRLGPVVN